MGGVDCANGDSNSWERGVGGFEIPIVTNKSVSCSVNLLTSLMPLFQHFYSLFYGYDFACKFYLHK